MVETDANNTVVTYTEVNTKHNVTAMGYVAVTTEENEPFEKLMPIETDMDYKKVDSLIQKDSTLKGSGVDSNVHSEIKFNR